MLQLGTVLELLDQGGFVSGEDLATQLGVSRTMVWKQIQTLRELGYKITAHPRRGLPFGRAARQTLPLGSGQRSGEPIDRANYRVLR